jgi:predicted esterase
VSTARRMLLAWMSFVFSPTLPHVIGAALFLACCRGQPSPVQPASQSAPISVAGVTSAVAQPRGMSPAAQAPTGIVAGRRTGRDQPPGAIAVPGDRDAYVAWTRDASDAVVIYLHGRCGDPLSFRAWSAAAVRHASVIAVRGDVPCATPGRTRWEEDISTLERRLLAAVAAAGTARGAELAADQITLVGYSQGAARAEALAALSPSRFSRLVLVSGPAAPRAGSLSAARAVALMAGERDRRGHLERAQADLAGDGLPVRYWMLPGARHGEYGPAALGAFTEAFEWIAAQDAGAEAGADAPD